MREVHLISHSGLRRQDLISAKFGGPCFDVLAVLSALLDYDLMDFISINRYFHYR